MDVTGIYILVLALCMLLLIGIGSPYGLHGFIPGILVSLVAMVIVSLITERLPDDHLERVWGER